MRIAKNRLKIEAANTQRDSHLPEAVALIAEPDPREHFARVIAAHSEALRETTRELVVHLNEVRQNFAGDDNAFSQWLATEFGAEADEAYIDLADVGDILEALR